MKKLFSNPLKIIISWIIVSIAFTIAGYFYLGFTTSGGEQAPLTLIAKMIPIIVYVTFAIAIITIPFYLDWVKKSWFITAIFIFGGAVFLYKDIHERGDEEKGTYTIRTVIVNGIDYDKITTYYDSDFKVVRSIYFTLDGKKDSVWILYAKDGTVLEQRNYRNDRLVPPAPGRVLK